MSYITVVGKVTHTLTKNMLLSFKNDQLHFLSGPHYRCQRVTGSRVVILFKSALMWKMAVNNFWSELGDVGNVTSAISFFSISIE